MRLKGMGIEVGSGEIEEGILIDIIGQI